MAIPLPFINPEKGLGLKQSFFEIIFVKLENKLLEGVTKLVMPVEIETVHIVEETPRDTECRRKDDLSEVLSKTRYDHFGVDAFEGMLRKVIVYIFLIGLPCIMVEPEFGRQSLHDSINHGSRFFKESIAIPGRDIEGDEDTILFKPPADFLRNMIQFQKMVERSECDNDIKRIRGEGKAVYVLYEIGKEDPLFRSPVLC